MASKKYVVNRLTILNATVKIAEKILFGAGGRESEMEALAWRANGRAGQGRTRQGTAGQSRAGLGRRLTSLTQCRADEPCP